MTGIPSIRRRLQALDPAHGQPTDDAAMSGRTPTRRAQSLVVDEAVRSRFAEDNVPSAVA
jgi:hypothetical protein